MTTPRGPNLSRPRRAVHHQREQVRDELHATVDRLIDGWPAVQHWASMATTGERSEGRGGGVPDPTLALVARLEDNRPHRWLRMLEQWRWDARHLDGMLAEVASANRPAPPAEAEVPDAEPCARCGLAMGQQMRRIDGLPYCLRAVDRHGIRGEACWWRMRREAERQEGVG